MSDSLNACMCSMCMSATHGGQKTMLHTPNLESHPVLSCHVDVGNGIQAMFKSRKSDLPLRLLFCSELTCSNTYTLRVFNLFFFNDQSWSSEQVTVSTQQQPLDRPVQPHFNHLDESIKWLISEALDLTVQWSSNSSNDSRFNRNICEVINVWFWINWVGPQKIFNFLSLSDLLITPSFLRLKKGDYFYSWHSHILMLL